MALAAACIHAQVVQSGARPGRSDDTGRVLLNELLKPSSAAALAGPIATLRGLAYFEQGRVEVESISASRLRAVVRGSRPYAVDLWLEDDEPMWACSCPAAEDGSFCKHCVAAARTLTARDTGQDADHGDAAAPVAPVSSGERSDALAFLADHVGRLSHGELVEIVLTQAKTNRRLRDRLVAAARQAAGSGVDLKAWRRQVDAAFAPYGDFVPS